jgi:signal transduction histidine kinase
VSEIAARSGKALTQLALALAQAEDLDAVLWAVAHEAIALMGLEDCVIYVIDSTRDVCVQRAAYGPKNPEGHDILQPIEIPLGSGIVGEVATSGRPLRIDDVSSDPRYILDDLMRASELAVPILHGGRVIGVLDSEHSQPAFYTQDHEDAFVAIATIAANRVAAAVLQQQLLVARDLAEQAVRSKRDFLVMMSHELRTPMNGIIGLSGLLLKGSADPLQQNLLRELNQAARSFMTLLEDVLTVADLGTDRVELQQQLYSPARMLEAAAALYATPAREKGLELLCEVGEGVPTAATGDAARLRQVLLALVSNAVKFTREGRVTLRVEGDGEGIRFVVSDTGIGIPADQLSSVFDAFTQGAAGLGRHYQGAGLGLSVARGLVERMGGRLEVQSRPGSGSSFIAWLPVEASSGGASRGS